MIPAKELPKSRGGVALKEPVVLEHEQQEIGRIHQHTQSVRLGRIVTQNGVNVDLLNPIVRSGGKHDTYVEDLVVFVTDLVDVIQRPVMIDIFDNHTDRTNFRTSLEDPDAEQDHPYLVAYRSGLLRAGSITGISARIETMARVIGERTKIGSSLKKISDEMTGFLRDRFYKPIGLNKEPFFFIRAYDQLSIAAKLKIAEWSRVKTLEALTILSGGQEGEVNVDVADINAILHHEGILKDLPADLRHTESSYDSVTRLIDDEFDKLVQLWRDNFLASWTEQGEREEALEYLKSSPERV